ncbi:hypothetical protein CI109_103204 [Kwoniella shandongensis]|uniref:Uncharacterized protein n=1 Tax=Kwoniella shandongensis TaxID=1734106 RepID=A0A5M6CCJ3_9TREE|nr:uncharacterized protein CI109_000394 [Kwoniella shandongensis]KAA5531552.1 hypothetical protein CI109_000394 [Kwoniella shandongensis]
MSISRPILASKYTSIVNRSGRLDEVRRELNVVINALPTQVDPTERELYLNAILGDLDQGEDAPWAVWPDEVYILALTAIKSLGRNPVGCETLLSPHHLAILLHHSSLPISPSTTLFKQPPRPPVSSSAREALKILANLLVLHAAGRNRFAAAGGAKAVARALANKGIEGEDLILGEEEENVERLFLLGRLGFLVTIERPKAVGIMVDEEDVVISLVHHLSTIAPLPTNYAALSELLKTVNNVVRFYPYPNSTSSSSTQSEDPWDERFDVLLFPVLCLFYAIPTLDLSPPLSHITHVLLSIPFHPRILPIWHSIPETPSPATSSNTSPTSPYSMKGLLNKISNMSSLSPSSSQLSQLSQERRKLSGSLGSPGNRPKSPSSPSSPRTSISSSTGPPNVVPTSVYDPSGLPIKLLRIFDHFFDAYIPYPRKPDDQLPQGLVLEEMLPPLLLLLTRAASSSEAIRLVLKDALLPSTLDRSSGAGPLEARKGTLGNILRLMGCAGHPQTKNTAGELMWAICKGDAADLCVEIGYGNAAGLLFQKGISGPPPAKIEELPSDETTSPITVQPATPTVATTFADNSAPRHPITGLKDDSSSAQRLDEMTQEQKEREAERLFVLFDRMEKNPVISMKSGEKGDEKKKSIKEIMREKLESGDVTEWERKDELEERRRVEEEERREEEEAIRELQEYKSRTGGQK